ncbi:E3 ubiquitin-protein ligase rnf213-alpha-like isoform X1 [Aquila chrysaetos chrysaetos]|uniref:E3 ubiquitin-protein ligase rnf213-alpha-like isoform X1 n=1 Tax=Aquila chrysaetos chrysaetos TaxID=223781 RepID=UPI001176C4E4|nr:E3 ubiquitin-protein ligase rnf213-alpha-like isoform X1 [Aquila chrysaetos chrysaetos]
MESAESGREGESREKPHPVPPPVQEGSSNLPLEKGGMKSAAPKSNKQQSLCTEHLTDTVLASQGGCDTSSSLGWVRSDPSTAYDSSSWEILSTDSEEEKLQTHTTGAELSGDHCAGQKSPPKSRDDTSARANEKKILGHQRREEPVEQRNCNRRDDHESKENLGHNSRTGRNDAENTHLPGAAARGWEKCICLENPYLSNERLRTEETMTLEFVAVMSKKSRFSEESSKICVALYKQPGQYQEFAVLKKRKNVIMGHAMIPISDLQRGPIFYKYAILNNVLSTDCDMRFCDLEHIYGMDSKNIESQLHRVINIPKEEIKADGTWTIFENMKCYFHEKKKNYIRYLPSFKFWSSTTMPQKSVSCSIIEHLADEFLRPIRLQNGFKNIERKLKIYTESFKIYLGDAAKGEPYSPTDLTEQVLHDNMIKFMDKIVGYLEEEEHKDDGLLFALHTSFCYNIPLSKELIIKAEKLFQDIGPFQGKFKHLRGKSNYLSTVKEICLSNKGNTLCIWLIPLLYAITEKMGDPFFPQTIPLQHMLQLRNDEEKQRKVLTMIKIHKSFIESCSPLAKTVLEMLSLKNFTKDCMLQIKLPPQLLLDTVYQRIVKVVCKPSQVHETDLNGVLNNIAERMAFWFKDLCLPGGTEQLMKSTNKEDIMPCVNSTYALLLFSLKHWHAVPFSLIMSLLRILDMFAAKSDVLQADQQFISERLNEFTGYVKEWLEKSLPSPPMENRQFLKNIDVWHQLFLFEILCVEWTQKWQSLIYSMVERWLVKVDGRKLLDFYLEFMKKDKCWNTNLETCFTDCVIQRIKYFEKTEEPTLGKMVSKVLKTDRSTVGKVLSAVVEKIFSDKMRPLEEVDRFVDSTGPVLTEVLSSSVTYDLFSAVKKSEHKLQNQINEKAKILLSQFSNFFCFLRHRVFSGDIPCNVLSIILQHQVIFQNILCICDSSVSSCIATVLKVRREEYEQLEEQKKQRCSFLRLCSSIEDVIRVDRSAVKKSIRKRGSFKDQMSVSKFSVNGKKESPELHLLAKYSDMMNKIHILEESNYFRRLWKQKAKQIKATIPEEKILLIEDVQENIYKPAIADFQSTYLALKDFSITLGTVQSHFGKQLADESQLTKEFKIMEMCEGKGNGKAAWVDAAVEKIKNYLTLSTVVNTAKMIDELRKTLEFNGNFQILNDLTKYEEPEFRNKRLDYMTQDLMKVKNSLSNLPEEMLDFLRELLECTRKGFVSWIKTIIKDKTEIPVFVDLASISAGENDIDIDKVRFFRDAMAASAPIIFDLRPTSGFEQFSAALSFISEATAKDNNLPKKLKDSCNNRDWIQMVHDSHGSIERSSISQARDINSRGIFIISAPQKCKAALEDCVSVQLLQDTTEEASQTDQNAKEYSLAQLTELQNKLMLITTKAEQGREEANRFLEILEKVQMVGKLYLQLLSVGNILFIDWKADIYCNAQHRVKVYTEFGIAGILVQSTRPVLEELDGLCKAMEHCLVEWKKYLETQRDTYYHLNLFTARQLFDLCSQLAKAHDSVIEPQILNMLSVIKHDIKAEDIRKALEQALMTPVDPVNTSTGDKKSVTWHDYVIRFPQLIKSLAESGYDTSVAKAALQSCLPNSDITEQKLMNFAFKRRNDKEEVENLSKLYDEQRAAFLQKSSKFKNKNRDVDQATFSTLAEDELATSFESLPSICDKVNLLWDAYCKKLTGLVSDKYISLDVFGETLKQLAALETTCVKRSLPVGLEASKPSLIMCKEEEMLLYMLSVYRHTKTAPLPTYDEVLVCTPDTEEEEVELIVRRALSSDSQNQKIYCLLGAEKLAYKVSKQLESHFFRLLQSSTVPDYRFIIFCNAKAHNSYVITAFDTYKVTIPCYSMTEIQAYLSTHLKVPCGTAPVAQAFEEPYQQNVKFVFSDQAGMGKSLFVDNTLKKIRAQLDDLPVVHKTIRLMESEIDFQFLLEELLSVEELPTEAQPTVFHIDVSPAVSTGLYRLLVELCILRHIQSPSGLVWKCKSSHLYLIEYLAKGRGVSRTRKQEMSRETEEKFLDLFPAVKCVSPMRVLDLLEHPSSGRLSEMKEEQFDRDKLKSEAFQRSYQYLSRYKREEDLDHFLFTPERTEGTEEECLKLLLEFCGRHNPSWTELSNFTHFLNFQLSKCEKSVFCSPAAGEDFQGFKTFVVKFMITMSKDFAVPSLDISDESVPSAENDDEENSIITQYQLRRKWEQESHPYIVFHADNDSMEFLGFHISKNLDAIDAHSRAVLERNVIKYKLYRTLKAQHVPFNKNFEDLPRTMQLEALCRVFGVSYTQDPDESYQLTLDNTMKMLAIHLRFQCGIPVIIMGETGCGKTKLVQFMCSLQRAGRDIQNMVVVRVHGGTTSKTIHKKVRQAIELARTNEERHKVDTVLFFDEANTSEAIFAIKEVLCDHSVNGEKILTDRLKVVTACNPYKRHTKETVEKLEKAGLGYRVRSEDTLEKLGYIPLRQLVYRVKPLPPSLLPLVWDFGQLNEKTQSLYIREIVKSTMKNKIAIGNLDVFTSVISASQKFLRKKKDECRVASLRDIERCMGIALWFYKLRDLLFPQIDKKKYKKEQEPILNDAQRALVLSVGACYYVSLESRKDYLEEVAKCFPVPASLLQQEIELCQEVFLDNLSIPEATGRNDALRENIFMLVMCMDLRVPLFLVGKPGSSKSLSKTIAVDAMVGRLSQSQLFKRCKEIQLMSFQCSPHSKPEGIISTFRQCAQFQKGKNLDEFASVVLLDEIGLAEDSPEMPLKTLHPLLEDGCVDDENPESYQKVGFVGISNWALDPAKMNRGLLVFRTDPSKEELVKTAKGICAAQPHLESIEDLFPLLAEFYCKVLKTQKNEFFGLRDFYSLIKMILSYTQDKKCNSREEIIIKAIQRNFGGSSDINPVELFRNCISEVYLPPDLETSHTLCLLKENMGKQRAGLMSRYLLLLTTNHAAFHIIQMTQLIDTENCEIIFGSGFPQDQDYSQVCRSVSRVKICMETGRPVVLLNIHNLYESLYDALNQCFVSLGGNYYVDLGLGTHRVKSRVKDEFRLIVIEEKNIVYTQFPTPLLNRLEKHCLDMNTILNWQQQQLKQDLQTWARLFVFIDSSKFSNVWSTKLNPKEQDVFIGFSNDTSAAVALQSTQSRSWGDFEPYEEPVFSIAKRKLVQGATPDSILRLKYSFVDDAEQIQDLYFHKQKHNSLVSILRETVNWQPRKERTAGLCLQVSTHARLLNERDLEEIKKTLNLQNKIHCLFLSQFDTEYTFRQELRNFFAQSSEEKLLLIQFHFDEPQSSKRLLACAKYCIIDERRKSTGTGSSHVVLATQVPRVLGGCGYMAFDSGEWISIHLDDLMPPENFTANLGHLAKMTIAEIFMTTFQEHLPTGSPEESAALEDPAKSSLLPEGNLLSMDSMIKQSIQKAVIQLEDKADNSRRATERIMIIHNLLFHDHSRTTFYSHFMTVLKRRICHLLQEREKISLEPRDWVFRRAVSSEFILEDTSFRHALWMHLEDIVANLFAQILAVVDANNNLDHLSPLSPFSELWLQMFKEESFLRIKYTSKKQDAKISVLSMTEDPNTSVFCQFPFSWVLKAYLEELWETVYNMKGHPKVPMKEPAKFFQTLIKDVLMPDGSNSEMMQCYTNDFLRMTFPGQDLSVYEILSKALLVNAKQLCSSVGQKEIRFSPIWLHIEYFYLREEYQLFVDLVKSDETVTSELQKMYEKDPQETFQFVTLDTLNILLKKVQPTDNLLSFEACREWLRRVKSIKPWMEWISMDNYQIHLCQKKRELLRSVLHQWTCTNIVYMFFDHLLHNETQIDEKLLRLLVKQFIFTWNCLTETQNFEPAETFELVTEVLKICNQNADTVYLVKGVKDCKSCLLEITDPAELPCGHIFCSQCICEWRSKQCKICKANFPEDYTPTATVATREAVACHNKFRRKCNSFFVEFVTTSVLGDRGTPSPEVITRLIQFVACKPSSPEHQAVKRVCKSKSELSPFEECMDTSPTIKSSLLKLLLRHGFNNIKVHLETYLSEMEEKITINKSNWNHFYFMVVHCLEDFMYPSQDDVNQLAESCLSTADLSAFCSPKASKIDTLQFIARLRFSISHVATVLGRQVLCAADPNILSPGGNKQEEQDLVNAMKKLVANAQTPWPQIFLIRNLYNNYGFIPMQKILQAEKWILPRGVENSQHMGACSNITLMFSVLDRAENQIKNKNPKEAQRLIPVIRQMENILQTALLPEEPLEIKMKKIVDALCSHKNKVLMEVVFHTALTLALSQSPLAQLFRNICFKPHVVKGSYLPTMPEDLLFDQKNWKIGQYDTPWTCQCGTYWIITNCGRPGEVKQCLCGAKVGGINHKPERGFVRKEITEDKTGKGYILGSPSIRTIELERDLSPASVCLARALLHSSMLLGIYTDKQAILSLMAEKPKDVAKFFWDHLEKDIECLAEALSRNTEDATVTVHLFLQHLNNCTTAQNTALNILLRQEDRRQWETCFKTLTQPFFQALDQSLSSVKQQRMRDPQGSNLLLQIAYGQMTPFKDQPNLGLIGLSYMWRFEQKTSIQTLMHLLQQEHREGEGNPYPVLLELMSKLQNIQHVQHLPDIFSLQKALIHFFQNSHGGEMYSVQQFLDQHGSEDQRSAFCRAIGTIQKVWSNIRMKPLCSDVIVPPDLLQRDINANTAVLKLLPTPLSIGYLVTRLLIQLQNSCVDTATRITNEQQRIISAEEVKPSSVLKITENDLITATLANSQYVIEEDGTKTTHFDFQTLQRQVIQRFISGRPIIKAQTAPSFTLNSMKTLQHTKTKVREQLQQEPLSVNQLKRIMAEARSVNAISQTLATLKVAAEFLAVTGGDPERQLSEYVKNELKMDAGVEQFRDLPVVPNTQLKHILSLWQTLSAKRSVLLVQMNQNPFCLVSEQYHEELSAEQEKALTTALCTVNLDLFLIELHEMITVPLDSFDPQWGLKETFRSFLEDRQDDAAIANLTGTLSPDLLLKDVVSIWKTAVRISKLHSPTYIQERPT